MSALDKVILDSNGNVPVSVQDAINIQHSSYFFALLGAGTLSSTVAIDDYSVTISSPDCTPEIGDYIGMASGIRPFTSKIISVVDNGSNSYTLGLDQPIDYAFPAGINVNVIDNNMNKNGSSTPILFRVAPYDLTPGTQWDITSIVFRCVATSAMDDSMLFRAVESTKGIVIRKNGPTVKNIASILNNGQFRDKHFTLDYPEKVPSGQYHMTAYLDMKQAFGSLVRLTAGETEEETETIDILVMSNLTVNTLINASVNFHIVED